MATDSSQRAGGSTPQCRGKILVVDDEEPVRLSLSAVLSGDGHEVVLADSMDSAEQTLLSVPIDLVFSGLSGPGGVGLVLLRLVQEKELGIPCVIVAGSNSQETAIEALRARAFDYLVKPLRAQEICEAAQRALASRAKTVGASKPIPRATTTRSAHVRKLVGKSASMRALNELIEQVASSNSTVLIRGESGTGKELVARALHNLSPRASAPMIPVNCGAIPEDLLESELFGHVKGSFTGAISDRPGRFVLANKGTIFLDEIGDMSPKLQVKVLRVLQEQELEPVGSTETIRVDVRVLAATNVDLEMAVRERRFREDLYYRLNVIPIEVPALRERLDDLPLLIKHFIRIYGKDQPRPIEGFSPEAVHLLQQSDWPGNVRELENLVERMSVLSRNPIVTLDDLPIKFRMPKPRVSTPVSTSASYVRLSTLSPQPATQHSALSAQHSVGGPEGLSEDERQWIRAIPGGPEAHGALVGQAGDSGESALPAVAPVAGETLAPPQSAPGAAVPAADGTGVDMTALVDDFERNLILQALARSRGVKSRAAEMLGIKRTTLVEKMKKKSITFNAE
jgi:DNA-binding NtrC family response regulator